MIIARGGDEKDVMLLLGLTAENLKRLKAGDPMRLTESSHPGIPSGLTLLIIYGETECDLAAQLAPALSEDTKIIGDPRL